MLPDAGPLINLAYADALDLLLKPGRRVAIVDMVFHELTRQPSPTRQKLRDWVQQRAITLLPTQVFAQHLLAPPGAPRRKAHLGEFAMQEAMNQMALAPPRPACSCSRTTASPAPVSCCRRNAARSAPAPS